MNIFIFRSVTCILAVIMILDAPCIASGTFTLHGRITDISGQGVEGAEVFIYDSENTRRPADFITPKTDRDGNYRITLPEARYWAVARVRGGAKYGPLLPGDRHSGEPVRIDSLGDSEVVNDFSVADIRETARNRERNRSDFIKVSGRIVDRLGTPVASAYVLAHHGKVIDGLPDFVSGWSDASGRYVLYLPPGSYFLAAALVFPPGGMPVPARHVTVDNAKIDIAFDVEITLE